ncbi:DUF6113 family protein [Microbacterium thalli]|uniref:DUF6113 family protein n=1 Tax=Microbacterium thalli TaxID=3027921 RepID=A0ABT5SKF9_9MICO|nr:DUF6113 family protein [Microbacterium thalli]MDD7929547.1 DUF6113 family protein [Microbacterium thalli]MDD7962945.1 DUF6113 family protein [Microbacterium thalli]MDN8548562.1 DUF6113 family protein [Microbacterium thalli]
MTQIWPRIAGWAVAAVAGVVYGVAGTIGQAYTWGVLPVGLIVAIIGVTGLVAGLRLLTGDRWVALASGLGALVATIVFSGRGPGGSVVVPAPPEGQLSTGLIWTFALPVVVAIVVGWPSLAAARRVHTN